MTTRGQLKWVALSAVGAWVAYKLISRAHYHLSWHRVGRLSAIFVYPLKSAAANSVTQAAVTSCGLRAPDGLIDRCARTSIAASLDAYRRLLIVTADERRYVTARKCGRMVLIRVAYDERMITLSLDGTQVDAFTFNLDQVVATGDVQTCL